MVETLRGVKEPGIKLEQQEREDLERFLAPFEAVACSLGEGQVSFPVLCGLLEQQRPLGGKNFSKKKVLKKTLK